MVKRALLDFSKYISKDVLSVFALNPNGNTRQLIAHKIGFSQNRLAIPEQVHSIGVKYVDAPGKYSGMDGLITQNPYIVLTLKVADCVPVYLYEYSNKMLSLVHSGWRGTVNGIIPKTIELMYKQGAEIQKILVYLGPAIGVCCYEVNKEVANNFNDKAKKKLNSGKWKVGLNEQITLQLVELGVVESNIHSSNICTFESLKCHSYRRNGKKSERMFAFMGVK